MLVSTKDQGLGRRRRSYSHSSTSSSHRSRSSKLALVPTTADPDRGSNGSHVSDAHGSKSRTTKRKPRRRRESDRTAAMEAVHEETASDEEAIMYEETIADEVAAIDDGAVVVKDPAAEKVDVFAFLVKEDDDAATELTRDDAVLQTQGKRRSFDDVHADGGSSLPGDSWDIGKAIFRPPFTSFNEVRQPWSPCAITEEVHMDWNWPEVPRPRHQMKVPGSDHEEASPSFADIQIDPEHCTTESVCSTPATPGFAKPPPSILYDLLASDREDCTEYPARCFKWANKRVLLHLQQEIYQFELELKNLDRIIWASNSATSNRGPSWQCNQQHLYSARAEVLNRLQAKLETYNRMVITSTTLNSLADSSPMSLEKRNHIRTALRRHRKEEFAHLQAIFDDGGDLLGVLSHTESLAHEFNYGCALTVFLSAAVPLVAFRVCSGILIRVIIVALNVSMTLGALTKLSEAITTTGASFQSTKLDYYELKVWALVGSAISLVGVFIC